jgi:hypothetical protein
MQMTFLRASALTLLTLCWALVGSPQQSHPQPVSDGETPESCKQFVQSFYDWYLSIEKANNGSEPTSDRAIQLKPQVFSNELRRLLREDRAAQEKSPQELVGLDLDPFLYSQDPSPRFTAVNVTQKGASYWVEVFGIDSGKREEHVTPELLSQNGHWVFVNFHYGESRWSRDENLLSLLRSLAAGRRKNSQ